MNEKSELDKWSTWIKDLSKVSLEEENCLPARIFFINIFFKILNI